MDATRRYFTGAHGASHAADRIVADSGDAEEIVRILPDDAAHVDATIRELGLSLIVVHDVRLLVDGLSASLGADGPPRGGDPLERLMAWLRAEGAKRGREFEIGKDRVVLGGEALPYVSPKVVPQAAYGPYAGPAKLPHPAANGSPGGSGVTIGVLDTPVVEHQYFAGAVDVPPDSSISVADVLESWQGHGTFVTGLVHHHAPGARILVRALPTGDDGTATAWDAARGMADLRDRGARIINLSIGCVTADNQPPFALRRSVERLSGSVVLVAAAGNYDVDHSGWVAPTWPAALPDVVAVGSIAPDGDSSDFSPQELWVDLVALGEHVAGAFVDADVLCRLPSGAQRSRTFWGTATWSGTSFSAATVSARLAVLSAGGSQSDLVKVVTELRSGGRRDDLVRQP